jgi:hypothetical protein
LGVVVGIDYPAPIVDHATQRAQVLALFKAMQALPHASRPDSQP